MAISIVCNTKIFATNNGWYCIRTKDHSQPPTPSEYVYLGNHNAWFVDNNHRFLDSDDKVVYLTFDAGYENGNVKKTLDILNANNVKSAFFILSHLVNSHPALIKEMAETGHYVCNHTSKHPDMTKLSSLQQFRDELSALESICAEKTGVEIKKYFRPPEGKFNESTLKYAEDCGYNTVLWSIAYADWDNNNQMSPEKAKEKILSNIHNGAVILLHPTSSTNVNILDDIIVELKNQGFRFGTLDELCVK